MFGKIRNKHLAIRVNRIENIRLFFTRMTSIEIKEFAKALFFVILNPTLRLWIWNFYRESTWTNFLRQTNPLCIIGIGIDGALCKAAKKFQVPTYELMHGVFHDRSDMPGFEFIQGERRKLPIDGFLAWDNLHRSKMEHSQISSFTIGYPNSKFLPLSRRKNNVKNQPTILITLSYNFKDSLDPFGMMAVPLGAQIQVIPESWRKIFRVHPVIKGRKKVLKDMATWIEENFDNAVIQLPWEYGLLEILQQVDLHITHRSASFFEASLSSVPTLITDPDFVRYVDPLFFQNNLVVTSEKPYFTDELIKLIERDRNPLVEFIFSSNRFYNAVKV